MRESRNRLRTMVGLLATLAMVAGVGGCATEPSGGNGRQSVATPTAGTPDGPFVRVVGTAQDGGLPHAACDCSRCRAARSNPMRRRLVAGLAIVLPQTQKVFLVDATPDIREQLELLADVRRPPVDRVDRSPVDGVFLTHAHIGHYLGLAFFGFEAVSTPNLDVYSSAPMAEFLRQNGPWSQLVAFENIELVELEPSQPVDIGEGVRVTAVPVPHRDEYADTVAYRIDGPSRSLFYIPDTDSWTAWDTPLSEVLADVDIALLDGTFFSMNELPGRSVSEIGHPLITSSMELLAELVATGELEVLFTHLNHSNPALEPDSEARREIERGGFGVASDGQELGL